MRGQPATAASTEPAAGLGRSPLNGGVTLAGDDFDSHGESKSILTCLPGQGDSRKRMRPVSWIYGGGIVLPGLEARREAEVLFLVPG